MNRAERNKNSSGMPACPKCGGIHYGSYGCPYENTVCDACHTTLLRHVGLAFCEGGKTEHDPRQKFCTCLECVKSRKRVCAPAPQSGICENSQGHYAAPPSQPKEQK